MTKKTFPATVLRFFRDPTIAIHAERASSFIDEKGRRIGTRAIIWADDVREVATTESERERFERYDILPHTVVLFAAGARVWRVSVQSTRNGVDYGARVNPKAFQSREAAVAYANGWCAGVDKRAAKVRGARQAPANDPVG